MQGEQAWMKTYDPISWTILSFLAFEYTTIFKHKTLPTKHTFEVQYYQFNTKTQVIAVHEQIS